MAKVEAEIEELKARVPELPYARRMRFKAEYLLSYTDAKVLTADQRVGEF